MQNLNYVEPSGRSSEVGRGGVVGWLSSKFVLVSWIIQMMMLGLPICPAAAKISRSQKVGVDGQVELRGFQEPVKFLMYVPPKSYCFNGLHRKKRKKSLH